MALKSIANLCDTIVVVHDVASQMVHGPGLKNRLSLHYIV